MRNNKTLLKILVDNFDDCFLYGVCDSIENLFFSGLISYEETDKLQRFIYKNRPKIELQKNSFWWECGSKLPRKRFLNKLLKQVENA
jgi:hypothetical protein